MNFHVSSSSDMLGMMSFVRLLRTYYMWGVLCSFLRTLGKWKCLECVFYRDWCSQLDFLQPSLWCVNFRIIVFQSSASPHPEPTPKSKPMPVTPLPFPLEMLASPSHPHLPPLPISIYCPLPFHVCGCSLSFSFSSLCVCLAAVLSFSLHSPLAQLEAQAQICASRPACHLFCPGVPRRTGLITPRREGVPASTKMKGPQVAIFRVLVCCPWSVAGSAGFHSFAAVALQMPSPLFNPTSSDVVPCQSWFWCGWWFLLHLQVSWSCDVSVPEHLLLQKECCLGQENVPLEDELALYQRYALEC